MVIFMKQFEILKNCYIEHLLQLTFLNLFNFWKNGALVPSMTFFCINISILDHSMKKEKTGVYEA